MAEKESAIYTAYEKIEKIKKMMQCGPFVLDCDTVLSGIMNESIKNHLLERTGVSGEIFDIYESSVDQKSVSELFEVLTGRSFDGYLSECIKAIEKKGETEWINMGDINFLAYGGCLVKPHFSEEELKDHESLENTFDVFYLNTEFGENGDENFAALCYVDLDDSWLPWADMLKCIGLDEEVGLPVEELVKKHSPMLLAKELVEYAGVQNFSPEVVKNDTYNRYPYSAEDFTVSDADIVKWLRDLGAGEIIDNKEE